MELTTEILALIGASAVVYDVKDTKFEWNSQPTEHCKSLQARLFMMSKIQNLNGTHNLF